LDKEGLKLVNNEQFIKSGGYVRLDLRPHCHYCNAKFKTDSHIFSIISNKMLTFLLNMVAFYLTAGLLPGVKIKGGWFSVFLMIMVISILNWGLRPFLILISFPLIFISYGLFILIINGVVFLIASLLIKKIEIDDLPTAILTWGIYSLISFTINYPFFGLIGVS